MTCVQIAIFNSLPVWLKRLLACNVFIAMIINFALSSIILLFTGVGMVAGIGNLGASVIFGLYVTVYKNVRGIKPRIEWKRKSIFSYPSLSFEETTAPKGLLAKIF